MTPRKGVGTKKQDKHSDTESEMPSSTKRTRANKDGSRSSTWMATSYEVAKGNPKVFSRLGAFGTLLLVTIATRFYGIDEPTHIW